jgi:hypothetical protein
MAVRKEDKKDMPDIPLGESSPKLTYLYHENDIINRMMVQSDIHSKDYCMRSKAFYEYFKKASIVLRTDSDGNEYIDKNRWGMCGRITQIPMFPKRNYHSPAEKLKEKLKTLINEFTDETGVIVSHINILDAVNLTIRFKDEGSINER